MRSQDVEGRVYCRFPFSAAFKIRVRSRFRRRDDCHLGLYTRYIRKAAPLKASVTTLSFVDCWLARYIGFTLMAYRHTEVGFA